MRKNLLRVTLLCLPAFMMLTGCGKNNRVDMPNNTAAAAVPPAPQGLGVGGETGGDTGKPGLAK